jgi:hypothetical protein
MNTPDNKDQLPAHLKQEVDEAEKEAVARMEIEYELRNSHKYKDFFSAYHPDDVEEFIKNYARRKVSWINWGRYFYEHNEDRELRFYNLTSDCLWQIQQKKLFNLQCQWRAERIKIPGIVTTIDFRYWEYNIRQCNFVSPISQWECELYLEYLHSEDSEIDPKANDLEFEWQDFLRFTEEFHKNTESEEFVIPLWYKFYDERLGTGSLMALPDIRGEKESRYLKSYYNHVNSDKTIQKPRLFGNEGDDNYLSVYNPDVIEKFVSMYENKETLRYFLSYEKSRHLSDVEDELAEVAFKELRELKDTIPVHASSNWKMAIIDAWEDYKRKQVIKLIPLVYENYLQKQELGISYETEVNAGLKEETEEWKYAILKGRELASEPPDFNF